MAVTKSKPSKIGRNLWRYTAASDLGGTPTFYWRVDGERYHEGTETIIDLFQVAGEAPVVWVADDGWGDDQAHYPGHVLVQIYIDETSAPTYDRLEFAVAGTLEKVLRVDGAGWYQWRTGILADVTTHTITVTPVGANGNDGTAASMTIFMVTTPAPPNVAFSYDGAVAKTVTIAAG